MGMVTAAIAGGLVGGGLSMLGAKKSSDAIKDANRTNQKIADEANRLNYIRWLESRGIDENGNPVNTKLPRWATTPAPEGFRVKRRTPYTSV